MKKPLQNYNAVLSGERKPRFRNANLTNKISESSNVLRKCQLCERKCGVDRTKGGLGHCKVPDKILVSSIFDHWGEEPFLIPSFTVFFWSCTFSCIYCQNWPISHRIEKPREMSSKELAEAIDCCRCRNVNLVGGEPTPHLPFILKTLKLLRRDIPVVWNSNFYMSERSMSLLKHVVDVYLSDFKYGNDKCAHELSGVRNYYQTVKRNHLLAFQDSDLVVRHLVLPGHEKCCSKPILDFIADNLGRQVIVNIMPQYRPEHKAHKYKGMDRRVSSREFDNVLDHARKLDLEFIY
jgi:putative pyruvate formate lyase activating enzyme